MAMVWRKRGARTGVVGNREKLAFWFTEEELSGFIGHFAGGCREILEIKRARLAIARGLGYGMEFYGASLRVGGFWRGCGDFLAPFPPRKF